MAAVTGNFLVAKLYVFGVDIVNRNGSDVDEATVRKELEGNICRCTGYHNIVKAIQAGAKNMGGQ